MRLQPAAFNRHLESVGQRFQWRRSALCPCRAGHSGGARTDCPVCEGVGWSWGRESPAFAGVIGAKAARAYADFGRWQDGDVMLSVPASSPLWMAGENDRVRMEQGHMPFQRRLVRDGSDRLNVRVVALERCTWLSPDGETLLDADLPRVDPLTGVVSWGDGANAPDPGAQYTLRGTRRPEYFLFKDLPVTRAHSQGQALPKRMLLRVFDLFGRN